MEALRVAALGVAAVGAGVDLRTRRIPNLLTFGAATAGLGLQIWTSGTDGLVSGGSGWLLGVALFLPMFLLRGMGAGDVKLLAAVGSFLGPVGVLWTAFFTTIAGAVLALVVATIHRHTSTAIRNVWAVLGFWRIAGMRPVPGHTIVDSPGPRVAYGLAIAIGALAAVWFK